VNLVAAPLADARIAVQAMVFLSFEVRLLDEDVASAEPLRKEAHTRRSLRFNPVWGFKV